MSIYISGVIILVAMITFIVINIIIIEVCFLHIAIGIDSIFFEVYELLKENSSFKCTKLSGVFHPPTHGRLDSKIIIVLHLFPFFMQKYVFLLLQVFTQMFLRIPLMRSLTTLPSTAC